MNESLPEKRKSPFLLLNESSPEKTSPSVFSQRFFALNKLSPVLSQWLFPEKRISPFLLLNESFPEERISLSLLLNESSPEKKEYLLLF
jgi:hypothetical protein